MRPVRHSVQTHNDNDNHNHNDNDNDNDEYGNGQEDFGPFREERELTKFEIFFHFCMRNLSCLMILNNGFPAKPQHSGLFFQICASIESQDFGLC